MMTANLNTTELLRDQILIIDTSLRELAIDTQQFYLALQQRYSMRNRTIVRPFSTVETTPYCSENIHLQTFVNQNTATMSALKLRHKSLPKLKVVHLQANGKLGIENAKLIIEIIVIFFADIVNILKTKNWLLLGQVILKLVSYGNVIAIAQEAWQELKDVDQGESEALSLHFAAKFDLDDDDTEHVIEQAVGFIPRVYDLVEDGLDIFGRAQVIWTELRELLQPDEKVVAISKKVAEAA